MKKKLLLLLSLVICMAMMAGCGKNAATEEAEIDEEIKTTIINMIEYNFSNWVSADFKAMAESEGLDEESKSQYKAWQDLKDDIGELRSQTEPELTVGDEIIAKMTGEFEHGKIEFTMTFAETGSALSLTVNEIESKGQIMEKALLNTLMGMGTVFCILILISLVISCFGFIGKSQAKKQAAKEASKKEVSAPAIMAPAVEEPKNLTDDLELVAVITAAIMASMGEEAPAEGLVVRSIKKRNTSKWKKA